MRSRMFGDHKILRDECMAVGFSRLLHMASLQTLQTKIVAYVDLERESSLSRYVTGLLS